MDHAHVRCLHPLSTPDHGDQSYGLVGIYVLLLGLSAITDMGSSDGQPRGGEPVCWAGTRAEDQDLSGTLEILYWTTGLAIGIEIAAAAPALAQHWLRPGRLTIEVVSIVIAMMGVTLALQWPFNVDSTGCSGLQQQVRLNGWSR